MPMDKLLSLIKDLITCKFWGILELKFENGKVVLVRKTENIKMIKLLLHNAIGTTRAHFTRNEWCALFLWRS